MVVRPLFLRAVVAAAAVGTTLGTMLLTSASTAVGAADAPHEVRPAPASVPQDPATGPEALASRTAARERAVRAEDEGLLSVRIRTMTPGALPAAEGVDEIEVSGTVTNLDTETWNSIALYPVVGDQTFLDAQGARPMRSVRALDAAMDVPADALVGERFVSASTPGRVNELLPGESRPFRASVPIASLRLERSGVYWFGIQALGQSTSTPLDTLADGRARTFLPFVQPRFDTPLDTAVVVPLVRPVRYAPDGSVDSPEEWGEAMSREGRLSRLLDFVDDGSPVSYLLDPAVLDAARRLAAGNPARTLGGSPAAGTPGSTGQEAGDPAAVTAVPDPPPGSPGAAEAASWLERFRDRAATAELLALPYGNVDVPATLARAPDLYDLAVAETETLLAGLADREGASPPPRMALAPPSGFLDAASIEATDARTRLLLTDRMFPAGTPTVTDVQGHPVVLTSFGATRGSPGPGPSVTTIGLRQRLLAEAAVRVIKPTVQPLVVVLPTEWGLEEPAEFFDGLDVDWLSLSTIDALTDQPSGPALTNDDLLYSAFQARRELDEPTFEAVTDLVDTGATVQRVLVDDTAVAATTAREALTGLSYAVRDAQPAWRTATEGSRDWLADKLSDVRVMASQGATLSGTEGTFVVTVTNDLPHRVTIGLRAESDAGIEFTVPGPVELAPGGRSNVLLEARTTTNRVHNVLLVVTDAEGNPIGSTDSMPIRSAQVSDIIWFIMGGGAAILFGAIAVRLVRRIRGGSAADRA